MTHDRSTCGDCHRLAPRWCDEAVRLLRADHLLNPYNGPGAVYCVDCPPGEPMPPACHPGTTYADGSPR